MLPLFDEVILLSRGSLVYAGAQEDMFSYFEQLGFKCSIHTNPADYFLDISSVDLRNAKAEKKSRKRLNKLTKSFREMSLKKLEDTLQVGNSKQENSLEIFQNLFRNTPPFYVTYPTLLRRSLKNLQRQPNLIVARIAQVLAFGLVVTMFFARIGQDQR